MNSQLLLSDKFLAKYKKQQPPWGFNGLGYVVYKRTYSRAIYDEKGNVTRTEEWWETIRRCIEGAQKIGAQYTTKEAEQLFDLIFNLKGCFAGRCLWQLGTPTVEKFSANSLLNCWYTNISKPEDFCFIYENLMLGGGVGYSVKREHIHDLPKVKLGVNVTLKDTNDADFIVPDSREGWVELLRQTLKAFFVTGKSFTYSTVLVRGAGEPIRGFGGVASGPMALIKGIEQISTVIQNREGKKLRSIDALDIANIIGSIVVSGNVRRCLPVGALVHAKQGLTPIERLKVDDLVLTSTGYEKVKAVLKQGKQETLVITTEHGQLECTANHKVAITWRADVVDPYDWTTAAQLSPGALLLHLDETAEKKGSPKISEVLSVKPGRLVETYDIEVKNKHEFYCDGFLVHNSAELAIGDPDDYLYLRAKRWDLGVIPNWRAMSNNSVYIDKYDHIMDEVWEGYKGNGEPYGFINLRNSQRYGRLGEKIKDDCQGFNPCAEISLADKECCNLSEVYLNNIKSEEELTTVVRLLYKTQKAICAMKFIHPETEEIVHKNFRIGVGMTGICQASDEKLKWLNTCYRELRKFDKEWSKERDWPQSIKLTTVKPSGTLSLLGGATPGVHPAYSKYWIRRVRMASTDMLIPFCRSLGYYSEYCKNFDGTEDHSTVVVEFPCTAGKDTVLAKDMTAIQQLELVKKLQTVWADNAVSVTVYYKAEELPAIKEWLKENFEDSVKTVSFLLHSQHGFAQAPYEEISEEKYNEIMQRVKPLQHAVDNGVGEIYGALECAGGACPVR